MTLATPFLPAGFTLGISSANPSSAAGTGSFGFTPSDPSCAWTASSTASFLTVTPPASGTGSGTVDYAVTANPGTARTGMIAIGGQTFTVNQAAAVACTFMLSANSANSPTAAVRRRHLSAELRILPGQSNVADVP